MRFQQLRAAAAVAIFTVSCSGDGGPTGPTIEPNVTYQGVFSSGVERGTITLVSSSPATGSLSVGGQTAVSLTGVFNTSTSAFSLTGGGYTITGTATAGSAASGTPPATSASGGPAFSSSTTSTLTGAITGPGITGTATMSAAAAPAGTTVTAYCGVYTGDDSGMVDVITLGGSAVATVRGMGGGFAMSGTASGSSVTLTVTGQEPGSGRTNTVTVNLTISGTTISGTGSSTLYPTQRVNVTGSSTACVAAVAPIGPFTSYVGWAANNGYTGLVTLTPGTPATGTIKWNAGAATALSGTYTAATGVFSVTGGGITINATASGATLTGTATGALPPLTTASLGAIGSSSATPVTRYCGPFSGGMSGQAIVMQRGSTLSGIVVYSNTSLALSGTTGGTWVYLAGAADMFLAGTGTPVSYTGTWAHVNDTAGTWLMSGC